MTLDARRIPVSDFCACSCASPVFDAPPDASTFDRRT
jgi:hypothetical protein